MLPLTFANPDDYDKIQPTDRVSIPDLEANLAPGRPLTLRIRRGTGRTFDVPVNHTINELQIQWFKAGSALNLMGESK